MKSISIFVILLFVSPCISFSWVYGAGQLRSFDSLTIYVATTGSDISGDGSESNPFATIQHAINMAIEGDEVCVQPGTYTGSGNRDIDFLGKAITVRSSTGDPSTTIIDCEGSEEEPHRGFIFQNYETSDAKLIGFTISNGFAEDDGGGGILIVGDFPWEGSDGASPTIQWCDVVGNTGGGVRVIGEENSLRDFSDCKFNNNTGTGFNAEFGSCQFFRCQFRENTQNGYFGNSVTLVDYFTDCEFSMNGDHGAYIASMDGGFEFLRCLLDSNGRSGLSGWVDQSALVARDTDFTNNTECGLDVADPFSNAHIYNCRLNGNGLDGLRLYSRFSFNFQDSEFLGNGSWGIYFGPLFSSLKMQIRLPSQIYNCLIGLNGAGGIGGTTDSFGSGRLIVITNSLIFENRGDGINLEHYSASDLSIQVENSTIANNDGRGIFAEADALSIGNTLIAFNGLEAADVSQIPTFEISCSDFFGNFGGDWTGPIAPLLPQDNNLSLDPYFCGLGNPLDPYTLNGVSPCAEPNNAPCGQIGARGVGCYTAPVISSVTDVGNDQGRQVRVTWSRSDFDALGSPNPITEYGIYRREDQFATSVPVKSDQEKLPGWDFLDVVPARGDEEYQFIAPTLCDSTITSGMCWSVFMVSAMTAQPLVFFDSPPDSGYSLDNLAPDMPTSIIIEYGPGGVSLDWDDAPEPDFKCYRIYNSDTPDFIPSPETFITETTVSEWPGLISKSLGIYFKITTLDFARNESEPGWPMDVSPVAGEGVPARTVLLGAVPNPFNPSTKLSFEMATPGHARLKVYDAAGRLVATLVDDSREAGKHEVIWEGRDSSGRMSAAGIYLYRLEAGGYSETKRMVLVK